MTTLLLGHKSRPVFVSLVLLLMMLVWQAPELELGLVAVRAPSPHCCTTALVSSTTLDPWPSAITPRSPTTLWPVAQWTPAAGEAWHCTAPRSPQPRGRSSHLHTHAHKHKVFHALPDAVGAIRCTLYLNTHLVA